MNNFLDQKKIIWSFNKEEDLKILLSFKDFDINKIKLNLILLESLNEETANLFYENVVLINFNYLKKFFEKEKLKIGNEIYKNSLKHMILSIFQRFLYSKNLSTFDFITQVFLRILTKHYLFNGNKRLAILTLYSSLIIFGYRYKEDKEKKYYQKCQDFVKNFENKDCSDFNLKEYKEVKKWILSIIIFR